MQPSLLPHGPYLHPDVVGKVGDVPCVKAEGTAVGSKEVGKFAAAATAGLEEGAW